MQKHDVLHCFWHSDHGWWDAGTCANGCQYLGVGSDAVQLGAPEAAQSTQAPPPLSNSHMVKLRVSNLRSSLISHVYYFECEGSISQTAAISTISTHIWRLLQRTVHRSSFHDHRAGYLSGCIIAVFRGLSRLGNYRSTILLRLLWQTTPNANAQMHDRGRLWRKRA